MTDDTEHQANANGLKVDYFSVPETFIDGLSGMQVRNGVVKLNFFAVRHRQDGSDQPVGVTTLAVNLADFIGLVNGLNTAMRQLANARCGRKHADQRDRRRSVSHPASHKSRTSRKCS